MNQSVKNNVYDANQRTPLWQFGSPKYWPTWVMLSILRLFVFFPYRVQIALGRLLGLGIYLTSSRRRRIVARNIAVCFPKLTSAQQKKLARDHMAALGIGFVETAMCWWGKRQLVMDRAHIEGLDHLKQALTQGRGVILLTAHFTTLELGGRVLGLNTPVHAMYRHQKNKLVNELMRRGRLRSAPKVIHRNNVREMLRSLRDNFPVWYAPDQAQRSKGNVLVPFFGELAWTNAGTSRLAKTSKAPVLPYHCRRLENGKGYKITIGQPLKDFPSTNIENDAARINQIIEDWVREAPEQYYWVHRRFKKRPPELPDIYK
ncbi:MAG: LpxL/LpxP family Kdo(2)-lipid IV(A) lauroyl/palmitoleoyl acyltransferase [Gammaproteobacteria bacterium]|nr:LpxL/LpxP family Kdo(2)-lipid IV(A) lauroyl/palmitoleoyl acyltransferase [Gammaproteobacteria bacterium]